MNRKFNSTAFTILYGIINVFTVTINQLMHSCKIKVLISLKKWNLTDPKYLNGSIYLQ